jgi:hypothetical protein
MLFPFFLAHLSFRTAGLRFGWARYIAGITSLALLGLFGCSSSEPEPVAQTPPAVTTVISDDSEEESEGSGQAYGGGEYASEDSGDTEAEVDNSPMAMMQQMRSGGPRPGNSASISMSGFSGGRGGEDEMGMGSSMMGMPGMGGNSSPQFSSAVQFVRANCLNCHGPQLPKGDVRLDGLSDDFEETGNATAWQAVLEQLESGEMPPPNVPRRPDAKQQADTIAWIKSSFVKSDFVPLEERDFLSQAEYAFSHGKEELARNLLYAHALAADDNVAAETLSQTRWFGLGLRPALSLRFAIGVDLDAPDGIEDLRPLGSSQAGGAGRGASMAMNFSGRGESNAGAGANTPKERTLEQLTGDFGSALITGIESHWMDGKMGTPFKDIEPYVAPTPSNNNAMGSMGMMGSMAAMGSMMRDADEMGGGFPGNAGSGTDGASSGPIKKGSTPTPGTIFIGTGKQSELLKEATDLGVDGLFLFDVKAAPKRRGGIIENSTKLRFLTLDGKTVAATSALVNIDIERAKMRGQEDDSLSKNIDRFFTVFDDKVNLSGLPALKPEHAHDRIRTLLADPTASDLVKMFEARLYRSMDLLTADELAKIYQIVLRGNEGLALAQGTLEDRKMILNQVLASMRD